MPEVGGDPKVQTTAEQRGEAPHPQVLPWAHAWCRAWSPTPVSSDKGPFPWCLLIGSFPPGSDKDEPTHHTQG